MATATPHYEGKEQPTKNSDAWLEFPPKSLKIIWGNDDRYWCIKDEFAELLQVCWLEVTGLVRSQNLTPGKTYGISFEISFKEDAFGWNGRPIFLMAKVGKKGVYSWTKVVLENKQNEKSPFTIPDTATLKIQVPANKSDDNDINFGLYEVWSGKWKGGLKIHKAFVKKLE